MVVLVVVLAGGGKGRGWLGLGTHGGDQEWEHSGNNLVSQMGKMGETCETCEACEA